MSHKDVGPKEQQQRDMREAKLARAKPAVAELREKVAAVKLKPPKPKKAKVK